MVMTRTGGQGLHRPPSYRLAAELSPATYQLAMDRVQLNLRLPVPLVAELKTQAQQQGITLTALVEGLLAGDSKPASSDLADQLAAIEARLAALEARPPAKVAPIPHMGDAPPLQPLLGGDGITTVELAERTGTNRAAWNTWAAKATPGDVRHHSQAGSWQLLGKAAPASGGPERWLWRLEAAGENSNRLLPESITRCM